MGETLQKHEVTSMAADLHSLRLAVTVCREILKSLPNDAVEGTLPISRNGGGYNGAANGKDGPEDLLTYLQTTKGKLTADGFDPSSDDLQKKIMPSIVANVKKLCENESADIKEKLRQSFLNSKVLPKYEADLPTLCGVVDEQIEIMGGGAPQAAPEAEDATEYKADHGNAHGNDDAKAEEVEEAAEDPGEAEAAEETQETEAPVAEEKPAAAPAVGSKEKLLQYLQGRKNALHKANFNPSKLELKAQINPHIANHVKMHSAGAPAALRQKLKEILETHKVLPAFDADAQDVQRAVNSMITLVQTGSVPSQ